MAKISIAVNSRDLREALQTSIGLVPCAKVPGLLRTLEKLARRKSEPDRFEVGVAALRYLDGHLLIELRGEDLLKESVVISMLHGADKRVLSPLHASLFLQLFSGNGKPSEAMVTRSAEIKKEPLGSEKKGAPSGKEALKVAGAATVMGAPAPVVVAAGAGVPTVDGRVTQNNESEEDQGFVPGAAKGIILSEKQLLSALKGALEGLDFEDLLGLNVSTLAALAALKNGVQPAPLKAAKRLVGIGSALTLEVESDDATSASLVRGLLGGLGFNSLMQLNAEFSQRMNVAHGGSRKAIAKAVKTA